MRLSQPRDWRLECYWMFWGSRLNRGAIISLRFDGLWCLRRVFRRKLLACRKFMKRHCSQCSFRNFVTETLSVDFRIFYMLAWTTYMCARLSDFMIKKKHTELTLVPWEVWIENSRFSKSDVLSVLHVLCDWHGQYFRHVTPSCVVMHIDLYADRALVRARAPTHTHTHTHTHSLSLYTYRYASFNDGDTFWEMPR